MRFLLALLTAATLALVVPSSAQADQRHGDRYFGVVTSAMTDEAFPSVRVGVTSLMGGSYWREVETSPGVWGGLADLKQKVRVARANGAKPMIVLGSTPTFHSTAPGSDTPWTAMPRMAPWRRYVRKLASTFKGTVDYQVWPEPNVTSNWTGTPYQLAQLQRAAWQEVNKVAPSAVVAGPAFVVRLTGQRAYMRKFYAQKVNGTRVGRFLDVIALDPYPTQYGTPEQSMQLIRTARQIAWDAGGVRKPIWSVEINYGVAGGGEKISSPFPHAKQISYVIRTYALSAATGVKRVYWLGWGRYDTMGVSLLNQDGSVSPAGRALGRSRSWMLRYVNRGCVRADNSVWTCTLTGRSNGRDETRKIIWRNSGTSYQRTPRRTFKMTSGFGVTKSIGGGKRFKVTSVPVLLRIHR